MDPEDPRAQALLHATARAALVRVLRGLADAGVRALPVKGVVTAYQLYAEPWERPIADVDIRVVPADIVSVRDVARRSGWKELAWAPAYSNVVFEVAGIMFDVEGTVGPPGLCALSVADMLRRATSSDGPALPELHDHALLLCVNVFKDKIVLAAPWALEDLVRIARQPGFDVAVLVDRARSAHAVTIAWVVADWLTTTRGDVVWREVRDTLATRPPRVAYRRALQRATALAPDGYAARILTRIGADAPSMWWSAATAGLAWQARVLLRGRRG